MRKITIISAALLAFSALSIPAQAAQAADKAMEKAKVEQVQTKEAMARVNINTASVKEISKALTGVGMKKAEAIVAYRQANGGFKSAEDMLKVKGIGQAILSKNADRIALK